MTHAPMHRGSSCMKSRAKIRNLNNFSLKTRSSKKLCKERLACKGCKPLSAYHCEECGSDQCDLCETLLHEDVRLAYHIRTRVPDAPQELLCDGDCEDRNFADVSCSDCSLAKLCFACDREVHSHAKKTHVRTKFRAEDEEFLSCEDFFMTSDTQDIEMIPTDEIEEQELADWVDAVYPTNGELKKSFMLLSDIGQLQVKSADDLVRLVGCKRDQNVKVLSIFGNPGDGKSHTLNHAFFDGVEMFKTSSGPEPCTVGVWARYSKPLNLIILDTEGFPMETSIRIPWSRILMAVLAVSDIIVYRTRVEQFHSEFLRFLKNVSYFDQCYKLEEAMTGNSIRGPLSDTKPSVIIFHETYNTNMLPGSEKEIYEKCKENQLKLDIFSHIKYIGGHSNSQSTLFDVFREDVLKCLDKSGPPVDRTPKLVFSALQAAIKFYERFDKNKPVTEFTCSVYCLACKAYCSNKLTHMRYSCDHVCSSSCTYQSEYDNKALLCKACLQNGKRSTVLIQKMTSEDSIFQGLARYAVEGPSLVCPQCEEICRDSWNNGKERQKYIIEEIHHIWPKAEVSSVQNTAQYIIDTVSFAAQVVSSYGEKPTRALANWAADQVAPSYWIPNAQLIRCAVCKEVFKENSSKHHCRACGSGCCSTCSQQTKVLEEWGKNPVRICNDCYEKDACSLPDTDQPISVTARKVGEAFQSTVGTVLSAVNVGLDIVKESAQPSYWVPNKLITECHVCQEQFSEEIRKHHCRKCGKGVCDSCSPNWWPVPSRGWTNKVRVCNLCLQQNDL